MMFKWSGREYLFIGLKPGFAFPPRGQLQVEAMVWIVWIKIPRMDHLNFEMFRTFVYKQRCETFVVRLFWTNENFSRVNSCYWQLAKGKWMLAVTVIAGLCFRKMMHGALAICYIRFYRSFIDPRSVTMHRVFEKKIA